MRLRGIPGMATHDSDDWILRGGARDRPAHVFVKIWREIGGKSWFFQQASTSVRVMEASSKRYAHAEGITHLCYDSQRYKLPLFPKTSTY